MTQYVVRRVLLLFPTLLAVYTITFVLIHAIPGSPFDAGDKASDETIKRLAHSYGADQPLYRQYLTYLWNILHGRFGPSYVQQNRDVSEIIRNFFPVSIQLGILAMILAVVIGLSLGIFSAVRQNTFADYFSTFGAIIGVSTPSYVIAALLILLLANTLHLVPTGGWNGMFSKQAIIPAFCTRPRPRRDPCAVYTQQSARCFAAGLRPHSPRERVDRPCDDHPSCPAQCAHPGRHGDGIVICECNNGFVLHRSHVQCTGSRTLLHKQHQWARLPGGIWHGAPVCRSDRSNEPHRGFAVWRARPTNRVRVRYRTLTREQECLHWLLDPLFQPLPHRRPIR